MAIVASLHASGKFAALGLLDKQAVEDVCRELGYEWNQGKLSPGRTVKCFAWQVLMGNVSLDAVAHREQKQFTGPAFCMARQRLPLNVLEELSRRVRDHALAVAGAGLQEQQEQQAEDGCYKGKRVFRIDGTGVSLPDSPEVRKHFGCSGKQRRGCGYPTAHVLLQTGPMGVAIDAICSPLRTGDMTHAAKTHEHLRAGDIMVGDVQFGGCGHLMHLSAQGLEGLFPAHHSRTIGWGPRAQHGRNRRFVKSLGYFDQLVEYRKPGRRPDWMSAKEYAEAPDWLEVREVRRQVKVGGVRRWVTVVTTLRDPVKYPARELVRLLGERWGIEVDLRSLKTIMGMETLRCQSVEGVKKELRMYLIAYNLVRLLMLEAARRQGVPLARLSFADALACLRHGTGEVVDIQVNPLREGRSEPRVVKRRNKAFPRMSKPRPVLRKLLLAKQKKAARKS